MTEKRWKALTVPYEKVASNDEETQCYRLSGKTVAMLLAMVEYMEWRTRWHKSDGLPLIESEIDNVKAWAAQAAYELMSPEPCFDESCEDGDCVAYYPTNPRFSYAPNNPFEQCDSPPAGYLTCPLVSGLASGIPGALPNDVYCTIPTLLPAPPLALIDQILNSGFPRVHMEFEGSGEIEVHLLEVAQGGLAIVRVDDVAYVNVVNLQGLSIADIAVSLDFVITVITGLLDWQFVNEKIIEFSVPDGSHTLDILFIPNLSLNILETGWGGGLRSVVLCGDFTVVDCPETIIDPIFGGYPVSGLFELCWFDTEDGRILRYTINGGCTWNDVGNCDGGSVTVPPPDIIIDPIDVPGTFPPPIIDPPNAALQKCRVLDGAFQWFMVSRVDSFVGDVLEGLPASAGSNIIVWLDSTTEDDPDYPQYYPRWKALYEKHYPHRSGIVNAWESGTTWVELLECIVSDCLPDNLDVTREVMNCISNGIEETDYWSTSDGELLRSFLIDYVDSLPLSAIRNRVFRQSQSDSTPTCGECTEDPEPPIECGIYTDFRWNNYPVSNLLGWANYLVGAPPQWAYGVADFSNASIMYPLVRVQSGLQLVQESPPNSRRAGFTVYEFDDPFVLCDFYAAVTTKTNNGNSRMAVAWARLVGGTWTPLAAARKNIYQTGGIDLSWRGASIEIDALLIGGTVGAHSTGSTLTIQDVYLNSTLA